MHAYIDFAQIEMQQQALIQEAAERRLAAQAGTALDMAARIGEWLRRNWVKTLSQLRRQRSQPVKAVPHA